MCNQAGTSFATPCISLVNKQIEKITPIKGGKVKQLFTTFTPAVLNTWDDNRSHVTGRTLAIDCSPQSYPIYMIKKPNGSPIHCLFNKNKTFLLSLQ